MCWESETSVACFWLDVLKVLQESHVTAVPGRPWFRETSYFISDVEQQGVCLSAVRVKLELPFDLVQLLDERHAVARSVIVTV